ncbi:hypothetical protein [Streptomyces sp. KR55]
MERAHRDSDTPSEGGGNNRAPGQTREPSDSHDQNHLPEGAEQ